MPPKLRLFLDTSVLFAGIWSAEGGARMLLKLGEASVVDLLVSPQVLDEIELVIRKKAPILLPNLLLLLDRSQARCQPTAPIELLKHCQSLVSNPGDAHILADALHNQVDYLVTLDKAHFLSASTLVSQLPFPVGAPGDCLSWLRQRLSP